MNEFSVRGRDVSSSGFFLAAQHWLLQNTAPVTGASSTATTVGVGGGDSDGSTGEVSGGGATGVGGITSSSSSLEHVHMVLRIMEAVHRTTRVGGAAGGGGGDGGAAAADGGYKRAGVRILPGTIPRLLGILRR